ncbi:hypothetical protein [Bradyrhizobium betae]|uniref:hypothetical protein n=1 Tax=Bradyrhizobium betae TaxID=244734 RepID=UPI0012B699E3|nr:hypothetical protein [Bradyrhizobium betae]MCS3727602.1 hypothetical protein [Bradyrhizobium betae]
MASTFFIVMSIWLGINIVFVAARLWLTGPKNWQIDSCSRRLSTICVKPRLRRHA